MKKLEDYSDEINKCSKCGLCQSVCPVYKITGNDCAVSRGKFIMLDGVLKGDLKLNKNINKYLDLCLKCNKCRDFCPSAIEVCDIFACAKGEYFKKSFTSKIISFLQSKFVFNSFINLFRTVRKAGMLRHFVSRNDRTFIHSASDKKFKLLYFKGCVNDVFPKVENTLKKVLSNFDVEIIEKDFDCCGLPFLSSGNIDRFIDAAVHNSELLNDEYDYLLTDCASCAFTLGEYSKYIDNVKLPKQINIGEFIANQNKKFIFDKPVKVTFHKPCHLEDDSFIKVLFEKCENVEYIEMNDYTDCCGFAGEFALKNNKISREISKKKIQNALDTNADYIITTCPACVMGLTQGLIANNILLKTPKVLNIIEFLAKADKITS